MNFKHAAMTLALASFTAATGSAFAQSASFSAEVGADPFGGFGMPVGAGPSQASWAFSDLLLGALQIAYATQTGVPPGSVVETEYPSEGYVGVRVDMPLKRITGTVYADGPSVSIKTAQFSGGVRLEAPGFLPSGKKNIASTGGSLSLTDLKIDFSTKSVYATLTGGNNVGVKQNQLIWNYANIQGSGLSATCVWEDFYGNGPCTRLNAEGITVSGLAITQQAFDLVSASMGWTTFGKASMAGVSDYGTLTISAVPEVSSAWMLMAGLAMVGLAARKARETEGCV